MDGKIEFKKVIEYINLNITLPSNIVPYFKDLILKWNNKLKNTSDYFNMKINHSYITGFILSLDNLELKKLWDNYINKTMEYRVKKMAFDNDMLEKLEKAKKYLDGKHIEFKIENNKHINLPIIIINKTSTITILEENTWDDIKRNIDSKLSTPNNFDCSICCLNNIKKKVSCNKCSNYWCIPCYAEIYKTNNGIIKCPYCRFEFGEKIDNNLILKMGIKQILSNI